MFTDDIQTISDPAGLIYGAEPFHAHSAAAIDAGLWPLIPVILWGFVILRYLLRNYSLRVHLHALAGLFNGLPPFARIGAILFCAICISFGLPKQNPLGGLLDSLVGLPEPIGETVMETSGGMSSSAASASPLTEITPAQQLACGLLVAAETNITFTSEPSSNAIIHQPWLVRGAHEDAFACAPEGWSFLSGTNTYTNIYVSSSGTLGLRRFHGSPVPAALGDTNALYLAPLQAAFGIVPAANWNLLSASNSLFWHDVTEQGIARFTWRNALAGRSPDAPVSFQAELLPSGDFTFRYDLGSTPWPSNALAGTRLNGGGENALVNGCTTTNHLCSSLYSLDGSNLVVTPLCAYLNGSTRFALHWKAFLPSDLGDPDNDGIDTADELLVYHTDPRDDDSDDDGLLDGEEISASLDPSRFSTATNGVSDLLSVITMAGLTNTSIRLGSGTLGTLVITSRLDTAVSDDAAILRITLPGQPSAYIPVLPGTDIVTSVSLPLDSEASFTLVATRESGISGAPVFGIGPDRPLILKDPGHLFGSAVQAMALTLPSTSTASYTGSFRFPIYSVLPASVCLHDPNLSYLTISSLHNELMMLDRLGYPVYYMDIGWDWGDLQTGANYHTMDVAFYCTDPLASVVGSHKVRIHACKEPDSDDDGSGEDGDGDEHSEWPGPPCCDRYPNCEHQYYGVPRSDDPDHPEETERPYNPVNKVLVLNTAPDDLLYAVDPEPTSGICPYCGHAQESAGANDYATITYCSDDLTAVPGVLRRSGEITVKGVSPSTNLWSSVLTIFHGSAYDMLRYTVLGTYPCESGKDEPATETWNIPCGVTNAFDLHTDVLLQDGDVSVSLQGSGVLFALNRQTQALDLLCTTNGTYTADVVQWRDIYCGTNRQVQAFLLCSEPGSGVITHGYSYSPDSEVACAKTLSYAAYSIRAMQITSEEDSSGITYNPCGIAIGGNAKFMIEVAPTNTIPDDKIMWSVTQGNVSFASGNNHGRIVTVNGGGSTNEDFKLEVDIENGNLQQKPFFTGKTLIPTLVPVTVWIVCNDYGENPPVAQFQFDFMLEDVNKLYKQSAMSFTLNGAINYTNASSLMSIAMTNSIDNLVTPILLDLPKNSADGIKLIFIKTIRDFNGTENERCGGFYDVKGIVLGAEDPDFNYRVIAHEIGHACGLADIYVPTSIDKYIPSGENLHGYAQSDWSGGYYGSIEYGSLIRTLLMFGNYNAEQNDPMSDISTGIVFGAQDLSGSSQSTDWIKTGLTSPMNRQPVHQ